MTGFLHRLVRCFPLAFRQEFEQDIVEQIERDYASARSSGRIAAAWFALLTGVDLLRCAGAEHVNPTFVLPNAASTDGSDMHQALNEWAGDLRLAIRGLRRSPGFAFVTIGTLALAIGVNAGMFAVVDSVLLKPLPFANTDRLMYVAGSAPGSEMPPEFGMSREFFFQYHEGSHLIEDAALFNSFTSTLRVGDHVERIRMSAPSYNLFSTLGVKPILGRLPVADDESRVAVISYALWKSWFNGDSSVIGKTYSMSGPDRTIIGVMGPEFRFPAEGTMLWISSRPTLDGLQPGNFGSGMVVRAKPGVTPAALAAEFTALSRQAPARFGGTPSYAKLMTQFRSVVRTLPAQIFGEVARPLWVLLGAVTIVLLIACANVANLFMVRAEGRQRDLAVRRAIGAGRGQLIRMQMAEALVVALFAGILATLLAKVTLPLFLTVAPEGIPRLADVNLGTTALVFTAGAALLSALACGLAPAIRGSEPDLTRLREGGRGATRQRRWLRDGLVVGQTALALVLLISSGLLMRSFSKISHVKAGYDTKDIFTFQIAPERPTLNDGPTFAQFQMMFMDRLRALPGVQSVGLVENVPLNESTASARFHGEGVPAPGGGPLVHFTFSAGDYFKTMGIPVLKGHAFDNSEATTPGRAVLSRSAAKLLWPDQDPIGRRIQAEGDSTWDTVVGVVDDVMQDNFRLAPEAVVYLPLVGPTPTSWRVSSPAYVVKTGRAEVIAPEIRALAHEVAPEAPMYRIYTMAGLAKEAIAPVSFMLLTLGIASGLALILGTVGLYGVLSYVVAQRTREIGVRMALGAEASQVRRMVVAQGARVVALGVAIGIAGALASTRALNSLLFGVQAIDVATFIGMSALLVGVGLLASYMPARRASNVDPIESLRGD